MSYFSEEQSEDAVIARLGRDIDPRTRQVFSAAIRHLHGFVKEVKPTMDEWFRAIQFLTAVGKKCDDSRQEWILASDVLGVSMLVDTINHRRPAGATENTVLGPFHVADAPKRQNGDNICLDGKGDPCTVSGVVTNVDDAPISAATVDVWQTNGEGAYDVQQPGIQPHFNMRGIFETDADGQYHFATVRPVSYPVPTDGPVGDMLGAMQRHAMRPAHIHFIVSAPGYETLVTHLFVNGDPYLDSDAVFGVKESLIVNFEPVADGWKTSFPIVLKSATG